MSSWTLRHAWTLSSDLAALELCAQALADLGVRFESEHGDRAACAIKMHGLELLEAIRSGSPGLHDLSKVSAETRWTSRLAPFSQGYMRRDAQWHGIPMGIHRANLVWVNRDIEQQFGPMPAGGLHDFIAWMRRLQTQLAHPLVMGAEPWQVGVAFEAVVLAVAGPDHYRQAFDQLIPGAWTHPHMVQSLALIRSLREFADESATHLPWTAQLQRLKSGQGAVQFMGDWVRAQGLDSLRCMAAPGTADYFVSINDFFVPLAHDNAVLQDVVGAAFTGPSFQSRFARQKGCMPSVVEAWDEVDPVRAALLRRPGRVLPSFVFEQCGAVAAKNALLEALSEWFFGGGQVVDQANRMAQLCGLFHKSKGLP